MIFLKFLKISSWMLSQIRKFFYNIIFNTKFKYFGKGCKLDIQGNISIGCNTYIGDNVSLIVEPGAFLIIKDNCLIGENCYIKCFGGNIEIGHNVSINSKSYINGSGGVTIGNNTRIGTQSIIIASNHKYGKNILVKDGITKKGVNIGENIWFGARVTVLDGVNIKDNIVVGACSLVAKNLNEEGVYVGIPSSKVKSL